MSIQRYKQAWKQARLQEPQALDSSFIQSPTQSSEEDQLLQSMQQEDNTNVMVDQIKQSIEDNSLDMSRSMSELNLPAREEGGSAFQGGGTRGYEGYRDKVYTDTTGNATIGFGHKLTPSEINSGIYANGITREQGEALYKQDQAKHNAQLYAREPWIAKLSENQQTALQDQSFNMGSAFLDKFPKYKAQLQAGQWDAARRNILGTKYAEQVGQRAVDNANRLMS